MSQNLTLKQLRGLSLEKVEAHKESMQARRAELEALKAKGGKAWTEDLQDELNELALAMVDVDGVIKEKGKAAAPAYSVAPGEENSVHLSIVKGRRFNPLTGKEESAPFTQIFSYPEWQLFKVNYKNLGYTVVAVLHDPYGEAEGLVKE